MRDIVNYSFQLDHLRIPVPRSILLRKSKFNVQIFSSCFPQPGPVSSGNFMARLNTFAALRPPPEHAGAVCELPYDVLSAEEAREIASGNERSFLHVSKPEIDFPPSQEPYSEVVYRKGRENFQRSIQQGWLRQDAAPAFYLYRQVMGKHSQTGLVALASCQEYLENRIKRHEFTRPEKEDDRARHIEMLNAQTGPAFLLHRSNTAVEGVLSLKETEQPEIDFTASDGVRHSAWSIHSPESVQFIQNEFENISALYIADGHHRTAAAARVFQSRQGAGNSAGFLAVLFPADQVQILSYNRVLKHLNEHSPEMLLKKLKAICPVEKTGEGTPDEKHHIRLYLNGEWHRLNMVAHFSEAEGPGGNLDVSLLQRHVLGPLFGISDPRTSPAIDFVGGIRGTTELERLVNSGNYACAFSLFPTSVEELLAVADADQIMPPKSTWFEPKLRDGLFCHLI
jgi:uncharacterized protein (DUF1015 family)